MSSLNNNTVLGGAAGQSGGYQIDQSIRFNRSDSAYMTKTFSTDEGDTWTLSLWIKRGQITSSNNQYFFSEETGLSGMAFVTSTDTLRLYNGSTVYNSTPVFRDPSAWYHIVFSSNSGTWVCYVNGEQVSGFTGTATLFNRNNQWNIGRHTGNSNHFDGYMAEIYWVGDQALSPTDFGETNDNDVWVPKAYAGTFGTNGFYLKGQDSADFGNDSSGNGNDFTSSGLTSADQRADTPTNNLMTFNPLNNMRDDSDATDGNRVFYNTGSTRNLCGTTFHFNTGKYVQAFSIDSAGTQNWTVGLMPSDETDVNDAPGSNEDLNAAAAILDFGTYYVGLVGSSVNTGVTVSTADTMWVAYDADSGKQWVGIYDDSAASMVWFDSSGGSTGDPASGANPCVTGTANASLQFAVGGRSSRKITLLEESEATGTVPTGFTYVGALKDTYTAPAITDGSAYFQTTLYTGTGSTLEVNQSENSTFQPDFVWIKQRNKVDNHILTDAVRGAPAALYSNSTAAEVVGTGGVESLDADGFTLGTWNNVNQSGITAAAWQWLAANGTASNTDGSITTTLSANTTASFSIIGYTGNATSGATIGHGLGVAPSVVITKSRSSGSFHWYVYHQANGATKYMRLNDTSAVFTDSAAWNNTAPTSSVITLGNSSGTNHTGTMIAYAFAEVPGFSKFGSYTGNGNAAGPFVWCGFRPAWLMIKRTDVANEDWQVQDSTRNTYNVIDDVIYANSTAAEVTNNSAFYTDFLSNGFKIRASHAGRNASGGTYVFMAFAEHPFGGTDVAPVPAR